MVSWAPRHVDTACSGGEAVGWCALPRQAQAGSSVCGACGLPGALSVCRRTPDEDARMSRHTLPLLARATTPLGAGSSAAWAWHALPP